MILEFDNGTKKIVRLSMIQKRILQYLAKCFQTVDCDTLIRIVYGKNTSSINDLHKRVVVINRSLKTLKDHYLIARVPNHYKRKYDYRITAVGFNALRTYQELQQLELFFEKFIWSYECELRYNHNYDLELIE